MLFTIEQCVDKAANQGISRTQLTQALDSGELRKWDAPPREGLNRTPETHVLEEDLQAWFDRREG